MAEIKNSKNNIEYLKTQWEEMFKLMKWDYLYKPAVEYNGWQPDFIIYGAEELFVIVKPYQELKQFDLDVIDKLLDGTDKKEKEILLLGNTIFEKTEYGGPAIGWLGEWNPDSNTNYSFSFAWFNAYEGWGIVHSSLSYCDRITGLYDGNHFLCPPEFNEVFELWNKAGKNADKKFNKIKPQRICILCKNCHKTSEGAMELPDGKIFINCVDCGCEEIEEVSIPA